MAIDPLEPVVLQMNVPESPGPFKKLKNSKIAQAINGSRSTKIITLVSAIVISISMVATVVFVVLANDKDFQKSNGLDLRPKPPAVQTGGTDSARALPGGGIATGVGGTTGTNSPVITLTADPASVKIGGTSKLKWSVTNNPTSCVASDDWSGTKSPTGSEDTPVLSKSQTYLFTLTCKTATGTGFSTVPVGTMVQTAAGTGSAVNRPSVTVAANPTAIYEGDSSTITWKATNNPTSCTASGNWSGIKSSSGAESTGILAAGAYTYKIKCTNSSGTSPEIATSVVVSKPPPGFPVVRLSANPVGPILPGAASTLTWDTTNSPTSCTASGDWSGAKSTKGSQSTGALNTIKSYVYKLSCSNSAGSLDDEATIVVLPNKPGISLNVTPSTIYKNGSATIGWTVTNITAATTCTGYQDWPGSTVVTPGVNKTKSTGALSALGYYKYGLTCHNEAGDNFIENVPLNVTLPPVPVVTISVSPILVNTNTNATVSWTATNSPTSCSAPTLTNPSNDLTGPFTNLASGSKTVSFGTAGTYTLAIQCSNDGGSSNIARTTLSVGSGGGQTQAPVVTISASPTSISTGSSATISWTATNSPTSCTAGGTTSTWVTSPGASGSTSTGVISTAGNRVYTITCTNGVGTSTPGSVTLPVIALPTVNVSLTSNTITAGSSTFYTWSTSGATSCSGSGKLNGLSPSPSGGTITTGVISTAGTYNYTITCLNSIGGSTTTTAVLTVNNAAPVYCGGKTTCYGLTDMAAHAAPGLCWGWNLDWVINISTFRPQHPGGGSGSFESSAATCNKDLHPLLAGTAAIPGYTSSKGTKFTHSNGTVNNTGSSGISATYRMGYYDPTKP